MASLSSRTTPPSTGPPDASFAPGVWQEMAEELAELAALARTAETASAFYAELLRRVTSALAAEAGAVWIPQAAGRFKQLCVVAAGQPLDHQAREPLLQAAAERAQVSVFAPQSAQDNGPSNPLPVTLVVGPVRSAQQPSQVPAALVELALPAGLSPAACQGAQDYLTAVCEVAADYHLVGDLGRLQAVVAEQDRLLRLSERVHRPGSLDAVAATIVNEARAAIGCDRVSVLSHDRSARLLATSGVHRPNRRSRSVRGLQQLASLCGRLGEPLYLAEGLDDALPQAMEVMQRYADETHVRQLAAVPLFSGETEDQPGELIGVLVAENFDSRPAALSRQSVAEAGTVCTPALRHAMQIHSIPLVHLQRGWSRLGQPSALGKLALAMGVLVAGVVALIFTPATLRVEARGVLQPVQRSQVFAPEDAIVQAVQVEHGQTVQQGDVLATLRDPERQLQLKRLEGEYQTTQRQLQAVRATRTSLDTRNTTPAEAYRLSAEQQQLEQQLESLGEQRELLSQQLQALTLRSPQDGVVVTWQLEETLLGRPVQRGQLLLAVANTQSEWVIELELPDDRIGHVLRAQQQSELPLAVEFRLGSQEAGFALGKVTRIAQRAQAPTSEATPDAMRTIAVEVTPDHSPQGAQLSDWRPGASVRARVVCGEHSLGYVWMHDLLDAARVWWEF